MEQNYAACFGAVITYILAQEAKGLVDTPPNWYNRARYTTHWGAHKEVMLPEVERIAARYGCRLIEVRVAWQLISGMRIEERDPSIHLEKDVRVQVVIWIEEGDAI